MSDYTPMEIALYNLNRLVEDANKTVQSYIKRPDANKAYAQQRLDFINDLVNIYNVLEREHQNLAIVYHLAQIIHELMAKDYEMGTITIHLVVNPKKKGHGYIYHNPFSL